MMKIRIITPVHIGTGNILSPLDFMLVRTRDQQDQLRMRRLNLAHLVARQCSGNPVRSRELASLFEQPQGVTRFLKSATPEDLKACWSYPLACGLGIADYYDADLVGRLGRKLDKVEVHETCKSGARAILPGSSLKGALIAARTVAANSDFPQAAAPAASSKSGDLSDLTCDQRGSHDLLATNLRLGDTLGEADLTMFNCRRIMHTVPGNHASPLKALEIWAECLTPGQTLRVNTVRRLGSAAPGVAKEQVLKLCRAANAFSLMIAADDRAHMVKYHVPLTNCDAVINNIHSLNAPLSCYLRVGWAVGRASTSDRLLEGSAYRPSKTRWLVAKPVIGGEVSKFGGPAVPLGWVKVTFEETDYLT